MSHRVSIVIPVYNAREMTGKCIASVLEHARGSWRLILVHDCSSDAAVAPMLRAFADAHPERIVLFENERNQGFVATANRGMAAAAGDDVLLLNSDTEVFEGFLERFQHAAAADARTGILTPFSNNATLCSIPVPFQDNEIPEGFTPAAMNALVASVSLHERPELVTAVGFAMYIKARVFADTGLFNGDAYGRGFGEENDFCEIAKKAGWKIRLCDDVFVWHKGKASFGDEGRALERKNAGILERRHPGYDAAVQRFIQEAPLRELHERINLALEQARSGVAEQSAMLFLLHKSPFVEMPGGTEFHVLDLVRSLALPRAIIGFPDCGALVAAEVQHGEIEASRFFRFPLLSMPGQFCLEHEEAERVLKRWVPLFRVRAAHIHHAMFWPITIGRALGEAGVPYVYTGHDYLAVCPNWNLFDPQRKQICPCDGSASCKESCLPAFHARTDIERPLLPVLDGLSAREAHREKFHQLLAGARCAIFPSESARAITVARQPIAEDRTAVIEHGYDAIRAAGEPVRAKKASGLRVVVLGEIAAAVKGLDNYLAVIEATRALPIEWHFIGAGVRAPLESRLRPLGLLNRLTFHGRVPRDGVQQALAKIAPDLGVLLPACAETFSYTLSDVMIAGVPVLVNEHGAPPARVRAAGTGLVCEGNAGVAAALRQLIDQPALLEQLREKARGYHHPTTLENGDGYTQLYQRLGLFEGMDRPASLDRIDLAMLARFAEQPVEKPRRVLPEEVATHDSTLPRYQSSRFYAPFKLVKPLIPGAVRRMGRDIVRRYQHQTWHLLSPAVSAQVRDLDVLGKFLGETRYRVRSRDPQIIFSGQSLATATIRLVRFRLRHELNIESHAQLYWAHEPGEAFSEEKSVHVRLSRDPGIWQEYVAYLDSPAVVEAWRKAGTVRKLRFDPIDLPGMISIASLEFGG